MIKQTLLREASKETGLFMMPVLRTILQAAYGAVSG